MKSIYILLFVVCYLTSCKCEMEITYCDGLTNNNIKIVEYNSQAKKLNLAENTDSIILFSENITQHLAVDGNGLYSKRDSILEINCLDYTDKFIIVLYQKNAKVDTLHFGNISSKIEDSKDGCNKKRISTYPTFYSNSIMLIKSYNGDCNNYVFEIKR